jgi:hypothetical protein
LGQKAGERSLCPGAFLIPIGGMGNVSDPDFKIVDEAKQIKRKEEDDASDPPGDNSRQAS